MLMLAVAAATLVTVETYRIDHPGDGFDIRITAPAGKGPFPVIVWSHGLGGSKDAYQPLVKHWAEHGYVVVQPTHADSLTFGRGPLRERTGNWAERPAQITAVIDALPALERHLPALKGKIDAKKVGMGGHSFGAQTAQLVSGSNIRMRGKELEDKRPKAFVWISPQGTGTLLTADSWSKIDRPILMISGDNDESPINGKPASWRREAWEGLGPKDKFLLWIQDAYHGFGGISGRAWFPGSGAQNKEQLKAVQDATTAFWDDYLKEDPRAKARLKTKLAVPEAIATLSMK
jgi:predicted dienelactone hydrolase